MPRCQPSPHPALSLRAYSRPSQGCPCCVTLTSLSFLSCENESIELTNRRELFGSALALFQGDVGRGEGALFQAFSQQTLLPG